MYDLQVEGLFVRPITTLKGIDQRKTTEDDTCVTRLRWVVFRSIWAGVPGVPSGLKQGGRCTERQAAGAAACPPARFARPSQGPPALVRSAVETSTVQHPADD